MLFLNSQLSESHAVFGLELRDLCLKQGSVEGVLGKVSIQGSGDKFKCKCSQLVP